MLKLINIELFKIFKHKSIYIILIIVFLFCLLNNFLYKNDYDNNGFYKYEKNEDLKKYIRKLEIANKKYNVNEDSDKAIYVDSKTKIDIAKIKQKYSSNDWRYINAKNYLYDCIYNYNYSKYILDDNITIEENKKKYKDRLLKFKQNNWIYFIEEEKHNLEDNIKIINDEEG